MFKKLKDKLAEEVKSSPQRFQQIAQAAQAVVTSASSSVSDITNNDLFSISDNDKQTTPTRKAPVSSSQQSEYEDVTLVQNTSTPKHDPFDLTSSVDFSDHQRQRRLSNSSLASDVSFRLPYYESPSMYHLQSDMEVSASEAEERSFSTGSVNLDRVTKEQLYSAYKRTQERYSKYRTQYADLARHYKLLERENAKAKSVLVETQDKALRRISELKEQCTLEQSAKAHLEQALRVEIEEKNMKIESLNSKITLFQSNPELNANEQNGNESHHLSNEQLIDFSGDSGSKPMSNNDAVNSEVTVLNTKIEKMEQLINKYKESLKLMKEKNSQITTELQIANNELQTKNKDIENLIALETQLNEARQKIHELNENNEDLQNKINTFEFNKSKEFSVLEVDFKKCQEEIAELKGKIEVFAKREEENAISLAENKLSIHKELESKEAEIKALKDSLATSKNEIQSLSIVTNDYKNQILSFEEERTRLNNTINDLNVCKAKLAHTEPLVAELKQKCKSLDQQLLNAIEDYKCLELQLKQETGEKLAMVDRNTYLNTKNNQLVDENETKSLQISSLKQEIEALKQSSDTTDSKSSEQKHLLEEVESWKSKYHKVKSEIHEEKEELVKLQSEIEKLLNNHELTQNQYHELQRTVSNLELEKVALTQQMVDKKFIIKNCGKIKDEMKSIKQNINVAKDQIMSLRKISQDVIFEALSKLSYVSEAVCELNTKDTYEALINDNKLSIEKLTNDLWSASNEILTLRSENEKLMTDVQNNILKSNEDDDVLNALQNDKIMYENVIKELKDTLNTASAEIERQQIENKNLNVKIEELVFQYDGIKKELDDSRLLHEDVIKKMDSQQEENNELAKKLTERETNYHNLQLSLKQIEEKHYMALTSLEKKNSVLAKTIETYENKSLSSSNVIQELKQECKVRKEELETLAKEKDELLRKIHSLEKESEECKNTIENNKLTNQLSMEELIKLKSDIDVAITKVKDFIEPVFVNDNILNNIEMVTNELIVAKNEVSKLNHECKTTAEKIQFLIEDREELLKKLKESENSNKELVDEINKLKLNIETLNKELLTKTSDVEVLENNKTNLLEKMELLNREKIAKIEEHEEFVIQLRHSHAELESEKDNLAAIIEQLQHEKPHISSDDKNTQTSNNSSIETVQDTWEVTSENNLQKECDLLKDENKRLKCDIEGLQTYLTQISRENSSLNDRLRELIASNEHPSEKTDDQSDPKALKIDELTKENTILVQENLELKEQLNSHLNNSAYTETSTGSNQEFNDLKSKYDSLDRDKRKLESRITDLEVMNRSISNTMQQMQDSNDKLKLSNEKLQLRLDEALVSLRHLHSLEENTELEYLRNILFEYLTGPGTHSATLAKVLAAVVKFDDRQTEQVMQKEKERQGLLGQLGLM